jgi:excisionase family DNA binding protein
MEYRTTEEVAGLLKVTPTTVQRWVSEGRLRGTKVGKRWLVTPQDLEAFVKTGGKK